MSIRKILISIIILLLLVAIVFCLIGKINIASWNLPGINQIKEESLALDKEISDISALTGITYPQKMSELTSASKKLMTAKEDYENKVAFSSDEDIQNSRKLQNYEIEYLWTKIGNHATKEGVGLKFEIQNGSTTLTKNLSFTVTGQYIPITDFIYDLENDDTLGFIIENFAMAPSTDSNLVATFMVRDIYINVQNVTTTNSNKEKEEDEMLDEEEKTSNNMSGMNNIANAVNGANNTMSNGVSE